MDRPDNDSVRRSEVIQEWVRAKRLVDFEREQIIGSLNDAAEQIRSVLEDIEGAISDQRTEVLDRLSKVTGMILQIGPSAGLTAVLGRVGSLHEAEVKFGLADEKLDEFEDARERAEARYAKQARLKAA